MVTKRYEWSFEVAGPIACFTRPDTGCAPVSYPAPTRSAVLGMMKCLAYSKDAYFWPERVEICSPIQYHKFVQNYMGPLGNKEGAFQLMLTALENVDYKIYGTVKGYGPPTRNYNPAHCLQEVFLKRLNKGYFYRMPCLGLGEFTPSYFGPLRADTSADRSITLKIPSMLDLMFDCESGGKLAPRFSQNAVIQEGVLHYAE